MKRGAMSENLRATVPHLGAPVSVPYVGCPAEWLRQALGLREGDTPFPWQVELCARFARGVVERSLDLPTGLGKTSVMAIWLVARACGAALPRRLVYVVDRRAVVDQATGVATRLRAVVEGSPELKQALGLKRSLPISTLRGQYIDNREWLEDPASPAIVVGTVDMIGSRLLFEGYGVSRKMRPYHAGLLGTDSLVVLDEAHLVPPFEKLLETIVSGGAVFGPADETLRKLVPPFKLLSLSATGRASAAGGFDLKEADLQHPVIGRRLDAQKRLIIRSLPDSADVVKELAHEAWKLKHSGQHAQRIIVFCDKREVAKDAKDAVEKLAAGDRKQGIAAIQVDTELFVGARRGLEREEAARRLGELGFIAGSETERLQPAFVFATSAGEVGVDLDADHMVSDLVAWDRMVQRLGRVNRRGGRVAHVVVLEAPDPKPNKAARDALDKEGKRSEVQRNAVKSHEAAVKVSRDRKLALNHLKEHGADASPRALLALKSKAETDTELRAILEAATTPAPLRPALPRALIDAWSMTSLREHTGRPEIGPWLRGWIEDDPPQTTVVWRRYLPVRERWPAAMATEVEAFFEAAPPHASEMLETETFRVIKWLEKRAKQLRQVSAVPESGEEPIGRTPLAFGRTPLAFVLTPAGDLQQILRLDDIDLDSATGTNDKKAKEDRLRQCLGGATLIVDSCVGGLQDGLLSDTNDQAPRTIDDGEPWIPSAADDSAESVAAPIVRFRVRTIGAEAPSALNGQWRERLRFALELSEDGGATRWLIVERWRYDSGSEDDRSVGRPQLIAEHHAQAERQTSALASRLGLPDAYSKMLAIAARLHDEGKRARRWQRAFNAKEDGEYAKTSGPVNVALLDGYRHEFGSLISAERDKHLADLPCDLQDLALHLIAAHHGFARPLIGTGGCEEAPPSALEERAQAVALRFARLQKRWSPWGLAWWEALLRAADQQASRENDGAAAAAPVEGS